MKLFALAFLQFFMAASCEMAVGSQELSSTRAIDKNRDYRKDIQQAIDTASQADNTVSLPAGVYRLSSALVLHSNLNLRGSPEGTILTPTPENVSMPLLLSGNNIRDVTVSGLVFEGGGRDFSNANALVGITTADTLVFANDIFRHSRGVGAILQGGIQNSSVNGCVFNDLGNLWKTTSLKADRKQGLILCCGKKNTNNAIKGCTFTDIGLDALQVSDQEGFLVSDNLFNLENNQLELLKSPDYGAAIFAMNSSHGIIENNRIFRAQGCGIDAPGLSDSTLKANSIHGCGGAGIGLFESYRSENEPQREPQAVTIENNTLVNNARWKFSSFKGGITISAKNASDISIIGNRAFDDKDQKTQQYGLVITAQTKIENLIRRENKFEGNGKGNIFPPTFGSSN